jgi:hypothetical protein
VRATTATRFGLFSGAQENEVDAVVQSLRRVNDVRTPDEPSFFRTECVFN